MARKYTKVEELAEIVRERHQQGESYREIAVSYGLEMKQVKKLMERQRRKERMQAAGYIPRPKGRPRKEPASEEVNQHNYQYHICCMINSDLIINQIVLSANFGFGWFFVPPEKLALLTLC